MESDRQPPHPKSAPGFSPEVQRILQDGGVSPVWFQAQVLDHLDRLHNGRMQRLIDAAQPKAKSYALRASAAPKGRPSRRRPSK